jgi:PAS domain S-box-containing protein
MLKDESLQSSVEGVYVEAKRTEKGRRFFALSYLISNLFEAESLNECLDVAIKGLSMLDFFQSQISLLEDDYFVVKRNHMEKKYQFLLEKIWGRKFLGHKIDAKTPFVSHLLNSKIVTTADIRDTVKINLQDVLKEYIQKEWAASKRLGKVTRIVSILPKKIDLLMVPLNYRGKIIGSVGFSKPTLERQDALFLQNVCELFAQAFENVQTKEDLKKSEEKYRSLVEGAAAGIITVDPKGSFTFVNEAICEMMGYSEKELFGKFFADFVYPDDRKRVLQIFQRFLKDHRGKISFEFKVIHKRGHVVHLYATPTLFTYNNEVVGSHAIITDITERKKAEEELIRLSSAVKMTTDSIVIGDLNAKIIDVNEATLKMYGTDDKRDLIGKNSFDLIAPEDREKALAGMEEVLEKGYVKSREYHIITKDGGRIPVEMNTAIMKDADGKPIGFVGISRDITERKRAEEALQEAKEKWVSLTENTNDIAMIVSSEGTIQYINRTIPPYTPEETIGKTVYEYIPREQHDVMRKSLRKVFKMGEPDSFEISSNIPKIGSIWFSTKAVPIKRDGKVVSVILISADITERKKAEEKIRASEERYRSLVELAPDGIATMNMKGVVTSINTAFSRLTGYSRDEIIGKHFTKLGTLRARDIPKYAKLIGSIFRGKIPPHIEFAYFRKDGTQRCGEAHLSLLEESGKKVGIQAILRDITERKNMEKEQERQRDIAITLSGARGLSEALNRLFDNLLEIREFDCAGFYLVDEDTGDLDMIVHRGLPDRFVEKVGHLDADSPYTKVSWKESLFTRRPVIFHRLSEKTSNRMAYSPWQQSLSTIKERPSVT